jgi:signal transduction histidine kinase
MSTPEKSTDDYEGSGDQATILGSVERATKSLDFILPQEISIAQFMQLEILNLLSSLAKTKGIEVRMMCVFNGSTLMTIREFFPFIKFKSIKLDWTTPRIVLIRDESEILFFESVEDRSEQDQGRERVNDHPGDTREVEQSGGQRDKGMERIDTRLHVIDSFDLSSKPLLVQAWIQVFKGLLQQRDQLEVLESEKHYADFLLDLLSHDIGNYNQIILLNLELAQAISARNRARHLKVGRATDPREGEDKELATNLERARDALERSLQLVDNVKLLGKLHSTDAAKLEAKDLLASIDESMRAVTQKGEEEEGEEGREAGKSGTLGFSPGRKKIEMLIRRPGSSGEERPYVLADYFLGEIFVNLFSNALKYTGSDTVRIEITIEEHEIGATPFWEISVADYGRGIPDAAKERVFDRFSKQARGTGLGLSIVSAMVARYEGRVWVEDRVFGDYSKGARFGLLLKRA